MSATATAQEISFRDTKRNDFMQIASHQFWLLWTSNRSSDYIHMQITIVELIQLEILCVDCLDANYTEINEVRDVSTVQYNRSCPHATNKIQSI